MTIQELESIRKAKSDLIKVRRIVREEGEKLAKKTGSAAVPAALLPTR